MYLMVRGMRRPVPLEGPEHSHGYIGQCGPRRGEGVSGPRATSRSVRASLVCLHFKLLANLQTGGDNLVDTIFEGLQERSRMQITNDLRRFIEVDNQEAV